MKADTVHQRINARSWMSARTFRIIRSLKPAPQSHRLTPSFTPDKSITRELISK